MNTTSYQTPLNQCCLLSMIHCFCLYAECLQTAINHVDIRLIEMILQTNSDNIYNTQRNENIIHLLDIYLLIMIIELNLNMHRKRHHNKHSAHVKITSCLNRIPMVVFTTKEDFDLTYYYFFFCSLTILASQIQN